MIVNTIYTKVYLNLPACFTTSDSSDSLLTGIQGVSRQMLHIATLEYGNIFDPNRREAVGYCIKTPILYDESQFYDIVQLFDNIRHIKQLLKVPTR